MNTRKTTIQRNKKAISVFTRLLRSGKDYTTEYMYSEAGKSVYMEITSVSMVIRNHYKDNVLTDKMLLHYKEIKDRPYDEKMEIISRTYGYCPRESRLIIRYLNRLLISTVENNSFNNLNNIV